MNSNDRTNLDFGTKKDTLLCVMLFATAIAVLISGAISVRHQNDLQLLQARVVATEA